MSIRRQLAVGITILMLLVMGGNLLINISQLRVHFNQQLNLRAEETATTLALSLIHSAQNNDDASIRSMLDVVFDRGHYLQVRFDYIDGTAPIVRVSREDLVSTTPNWFSQGLSLTGGYSEAFVSKGWNQLGLLQVQMHPGLAYQQMWRSVKAETAWFALMLFVVLYGLRLLLVWQLKPLSAVLELADKLASNQFSHITEQPKAKELKTLVRAMNHLSDRLQASFVAHSETVRHLQRENFHDSLTELNNRKGWDRFLNDWMKAESFAPGWMMLIRIENLVHLNTLHGKSLVDEIIMQIALLLKTAPNLSREHVCVARLGGEFWIFSPDTLDKGSEKRMEHLANSVRQLSHVQHHQVLLSIAGLPIADVVAPSSLKHQLDILIERCSLEQHEFLLGKLENHTLTNWIHWQKRLRDALKNEQIELFSQGVFDNKGVLVQREIHCRLRQTEGEPLLAGYFWPMVDRLDFSIDFDCLIIQKWQNFFDSLNNDTSTNKGSIDWVLNISSKSINDKDFRKWFENTVKQPALTKMIIECSEYTLAYINEGALPWLHKMSKRGLRLSVDHVGTSGKSFGFLARFPIYQGKIEKRFIRDIDQQNEHAFFVSGMIKVFHAQQALCIAEGIETEQEKQTLIDLGVDGVMGYGLDAPQSL
jgi:EAL domain-containing protein (putative c-di-GMP-specific phosphodiesterase class I)/GGDEF domain-containing protein